MRVVQNLFGVIALIVLSNLTVTRCKLFCQQHAKQDSLTSRVGLFLSSNLSLSKINKFRSDLCCGRRPFSSSDKICCFGKIISKITMRCCPDGSFLPKDSVCRCHPSSKWVVSQITKMDFLERKHFHLIEELTLLLKDTKTRLDNLQNEIIRMDAKAQYFYDLFFQMTGIERTDSEEAKQIIDLIKFQNSFEKEDELTSEKYISYIDYNPKARIFDNKMQQDRKFVNMDNSDKKSIEMLVLEREAILSKLKTKHWELKAIHKVLINEKEIYDIAANDRLLLANFRGIFDELMTLVIEMETALRQEYPEYTRIIRGRNETQSYDEKDTESLEDLRMQLRQRLAEDPMGLSLNSSIDDPKHDSHQKKNESQTRLCDFSAWIRYLASYESRISAIGQDIKHFQQAFLDRRSVEKSEIKTIDQLQRSIKQNFLVERYHRRF